MNLGITLLQLGSDYKGFFEELMEWDFVEAFVGAYASSVGLFVTGTLFYVPIALSMYIMTGSMMIPFVLLLLFGGAIIPQMIAPIPGFVSILVVGVGAGTLTYLYYTFSR